MDVLEATILREVPRQHPKDIGFEVLATLFINPSLIPRVGDYIQFERDENPYEVTVKFVKWNYVKSSFGNQRYLVDNVEIIIQ